MKYMQQLPEKKYSIRTETIQAYLKETESTIYHINYKIFIQ